MVEMAVAAALALLVLLVLLPTLRRNREVAQTSRDSTITVNLRRIESAKAFYVADKGRKPGDRVTMADLLKSGYLPADPHAATGVIFDPGIVGSNPTFTIDPKHRHD